MRQIKRFLFGLFLCVAFLPCVFAKCTNEESAELNSFAANVKANYEEVQRERGKNEYTAPDAVLGKEAEKEYVSYEDYFRINIHNVTEKLKVEVENNYNSTTWSFDSDDAENGVVSFDWKNIEKITTFTIRIYANGDKSCKDDLLKKLYVTTPRYNDFYLYDACQGLEELDVCQKFVTFKSLDYNAFIRRVDDYKKQHNKSEQKEDFIKKNKKVIVISGLLLVAVAGVGVTVIVMKKRSNEI